MVSVRRCGVSARLSKDGQVQSQVPRARYEAIAVGSGLALRQRSDLLDALPFGLWTGLGDDEFLKVTTSDAANVRSKVVGRIEFVRRRLVRT